VKARATGASLDGEIAMMKRLGAELIGTFWLVLGGCGSAVLAANFGGDGNPLGIGLLGVSLAFGLTVLTMALFARATFRAATSTRR
jgi:glycerol uptake facilitator-like aquaporin